MFVRQDNRHAGARICWVAFATLKNSSSGISLSQEYFWSHEVPDQETLSDKSPRVSMSGMTVFDC
ncbi:MAG: hypothetical protein ACJATL_001090 [Rickettsiales bacterium]|jgi:hypothetical protein